MISFPVTLPFQNKERVSKQVLTMHRFLICDCVIERIFVCACKCVYEEQGESQEKGKKLLDLHQRPHTPTGSSKGYVLLRCAFGPARMATPLLQP